jgi:DNA repair exonuclease SbcCD nuclease subunit
MALIAVLGDTHFGANNSNKMFLDYQDSYFEVLVEQLTDLGVTDLFHVGDLYDVRKSINFKTLRRSASFFRQRMIDAPFNVHLIVGNHDSYSKNTLKVNAITELLDWTDFKIYTEPQEIEVQGCKILMMPWICKDNEDRSYELLEKSYTDICMGHFDISGFGMSKEVINKSGMSRSVFNKFKRTFSGHFHLPSQQDNIMYTGSPYQLSWSDYGDIKRVILYDTETDKISFIENHNTIFEKIIYKEGLEVKPDEFKDKIVKIYSDASTNAYEFDLFVKVIESHNPYNISVIDHVSYDESANSKEVDMTKDTMSFLVDCIDSVEASDDEKDAVKTLMLKLYIKAQELT